MADHSLSSIPENFPQFDAEYPQIDVQFEYDRFRNYCAAHGRRYKNYHAAFRNWLSGPYPKKPRAERKVAYKMCVECGGTLELRNPIAINPECPVCSQKDEPVVLYDIMTAFQIIKDS